MAFDFLKDLIESRAILRTLSRIAAAEEDQATSLRRLADRYAPDPLPEPPPDDLRQTFPAFGRDTEFARIEAFKEQALRDLKREPTEEEILAFLDGKEVSLDR